MKIEVPKNLYSIVEERLAPLGDFVCKDLKQHTKMMVEEYNMPFYPYGICELNRFCHIHESYSKKKFEQIMSKINK